MSDLATDVLVIGAGPSGLTAAAALAPHVKVLVLEREAEAGGIPRHSDHLGYGMRDLRTFIGGPAYARRLVDRATRAGAEIHTHSTVTGWADPLTVQVTSPQGRQAITARAIVLATGARERPRPARLVPGDRPAGVYTTGQLQNLVHLHHAEPGTRAVVVGAELVSWSAVMTLREAGARTVLMTTEHPKAESYAAFSLAGRFALRVPVATQTRLTRIIGSPRVQAVEVTDLRTGAVRTVACDTVVFTGDWIPDHELARLGGVQTDPHTRGPAVDAGLRTSAPGVFAIGNLVHPVDTADVAALDGRAVAAAVLAHLGSGRWTGPADGAAIVPGRGLSWITPNAVSNASEPPPRDRLLSWPTSLVRVPRVTATQGGRILARRRLPWPASPGRVLRIPASLIRGADPTGGEIRIDVG